MAAINNVSYPYGGSNLDAAAFPAVVALEGDGVRTLQVLVPNGTLRPIDPDAGTTIPLSAVRGPANEVLTEYPETDGVGEWHFCLIGYPTCSLGVTGPETDATEKVYENITSAQAIRQVIAQGIAEATAFDGTVDWVTQVDNKPTIPGTAADVSAIPATSRGAADGVAPLDADAKVPIGNLPVGAGPTQVAAGPHAHTFGFSSLPGLPYARLAVVILQTSPGVYTDLPADLRSALLLRIFQGTTKPATSVGVATKDWWVNEAPATS
jgi:hypothetical protein